MKDAVEDNRRRIPLERLLAGSHFVKDRAKRKDISASVQFLSTRLFRRHVRDGAHGQAWTGEQVGGHCHSRHSGRSGTSFRQLGDRHSLGQAEIQKFGLAALGDEDISRLDIAMDDALRMRGVQSVSHFCAQLYDFFRWQRPSRDVVGERYACQQLHRDERTPFMFVHFVDRADVGMVQGRG